jgi:hypothetical protein
MKLGVSYNVFDGEELLENSIKSIRGNADYISVVYQEISNFGNPCNPNLVPLLNRLKEDGLVDELYKYKPQPKRGGHFNEINKRNVGLFLSEGAKCTHHMAMDSDEFYTDDEFKYLKNEIVSGNYDSSCCQMTTYYKEPQYRLDPKEDYYVSLIYKIQRGKQYVMGLPFPTLVDPTRRMEAGKCKIFTRDEIEMHHMSYVRKNIRIKLTNSSAFPNFKNIDKLVDYFEKWEYPQQGLMGGAPDKFYDIVKVDRQFNTWE